MNSLNRIFVICTIIITLVCTATGQELKKSAAGIWTGEIIHGEDNFENILIRIYDTPIQNQCGYVISSRQTYEIVPIDTASIENGTIFFGSPLTGSNITGKLKEDGKTWDCIRQTGKKIYRYQQNMLLKQASSLPEWASNIRHIIYKNGVYEANIHPSPFGHRPYCEVKVEKGRIVEVLYYEKHDSTGELKDENYGREYVEDLGELAYPAAQLSVKGASIYGLRLILSQDPDNLDVITGATANYHRFKEVVKKALKSAILKK